MALTADDILGNPAVGPCVRRLAQALLMIHDASPRLASLFGTRQRWLMAHAAVAQYFRDVGAADPGAGLSMARLLDLVERYEVASRNTAAAFLKEMLKYDIVRHVAASEGKRHRTFEPAPTTLAALFQWHVLHLATLDGIDGGTRSATLSAAPEALQRLQPLIADGILGDNTVRKPEPTFALFAWVDEGGIVMDRLIVGCEEGAADRDRVTTDATSVSGLAQRLKLSRTQLGRKLAVAEAMGSLAGSARAASPGSGSAKAFVTNITRRRRSSLRSSTRRMRPVSCRRRLRSRPISICLAGEGSLPASFGALASETDGLMPSTQCSGRQNSVSAGSESAGPCPAPPNQRFRRKFQCRHCHCKASRFST